MGFFPLPLSSGDKSKNKTALLMQKYSAGCFLLEEKDACPEKLSAIIKKIILAKKNHARLEKISHSYYKGGAAEKIYHSIYKYFENKNELVT